MLVRDWMTQNPLIVSPRTSVEEAMRTMRENRVRHLPVVKDDGSLAGIITETDLFNLFTEQLGARRAGVRLMVRIQDIKGEMARLTGRIAEAGGNIVRLTTLSAEDPAFQIATLKVEGVPRDTLVRELSPMVAEIVDVRELQGWESGAYSSCHWTLEP